MFVMSTRWKKRGTRIAPDNEGGAWKGLSMVRPSKHSVAVHFDPFIFGGVGLSMGELYSIFIILGERR